MDLVPTTHTGMATEEFEEIVKDWLKAARHPRFKRPYTDLVYQPMIELLAYLRANGIKTFIVSGGGTDFMRSWVPGAYGIPPDRLPEIDFINDKSGKAMGIHKFIGRRPVMMFGNSDGDFEMLQYTTASPGPRFGLIVHHTDAECEWADDRDSPVGRLDKAFDEAPKRGWVVVDMKADWKKVFAFEK